MIKYDLNDHKKIDLLSNTLYEEALNNLNPLLLEYATEVGRNIGDFKLNYNFSILLKGRYTVPVFEMKINFFYDFESRGYYSLLMDMDLNPIDDFFVIK